MILFAVACSNPTPSDPPVALQPEDDLCDVYWALQVQDEPTYAGDPATCMPGTADNTGIQNSLDHLNHARSLAGLSPFALAPSQAAQQTAALMHANGRLSHDPDTGWTCFNQSTADTAAQSLLAAAPAVEAIRQYLVDFGNERTLVHRRWLLSDWIDQVGIGSTDDYNAIDLGSDYTTGTGWTAWPPPTRIPLPLMRYTQSMTTDSEGWSIQSDELALEGSQVFVTGPDGPLEVQVSDLEPNFGSRSAIRILPVGWRSRPGIYEVEVPTHGIAYQVEFVGCPDPRR